MSSRQYTVSIKLKDDGILKKLEGLGGSSAGGDIFKKIEALNAGQLLKLTGIGIGVGSLVAAATKSSAILQGTFKLWETSMMLIFKPFADFIGLALRPLTLTMLMFAIPFYKWAGPLFRDYATKIGEFFSNPSKALATLATAIGGAVAIQLASRVPNTPGTPSATPTPMESKCIELCGKTVSRLPKPVSEGVKDGIGNSSMIPIIAAISTSTAAISATTLLMNSTLTDVKTDIRLLKESMNNLARPPSSAGNSTTVSIFDSLKISDIVGGEVFEGIKTDWGSVATSSAAGAASASLAAKYLDEAAAALSGAVSRLQSYASTIPNQFSWGFEYFGNGKVTPAAGGQPYAYNNGWHSGCGECLEMSGIENRSFVATQEAITIMPCNTYCAMEAVTVDLETITMEELIATQKALLSELEEGPGQEEEDIETLRKEAYRMIIKKLEREI